MLLLLFVGRRFGFLSHVASKLLVSLAEDAVDVVIIVCWSSYLFMDVECWLCSKCTFVEMKVSSCLCLFRTYVYLFIVMMLSCSAGKKLC